MVQCLKKMVLVRCSHFYWWFMPLQEALETCQTRISKMEVQQQHQHQQLVTMEGVENATVKALVGKLINLLLSVLAVILVFVSTASSIMMPFVRNQVRNSQSFLDALYVSCMVDFKPCVSVAGSHFCSRCNFSRHYRILLWIWWREVIS